MVNLSKVKEDQFFYLDLIICLEERKGEIESCLPNVNDNVFEEYCLIVELLGVLYEKISNLKEE